METIALSDYILSGFLGFICLLMVAMIVALIRESGAIGELKGEVRGINLRIDEMSKGHSERMDALTARVERLEDGLSALAREVGEIKGLLLALHQRVDLVMRHRHHQDGGQVMLTPEEVAAD